MFSSKVFSDIAISKFGKLKTALEELQKKAWMKIRVVLLFQRK